MEISEEDKALIRKEIAKMSKRLERVQQKYQQAKTSDRRETLELLIENIKMHIGYKLYDCEDYEEQLKVYQSMSGKKYGEFKYNGLSMALLMMERYDETRQVLEEGLQRFPNSQFLLLKMGDLCKCQGLYIDALKYFKKALKNCPESYLALYSKATTLSELGFYEDSLSIVRKLLEEDPDHGSYLCEAGYCLQLMGYPEEAVEYYKKALDCGYLSNVIYGGLACAYTNLGFNHDALEIAQKGLKEFPDSPCMYEILSSCYMEYGWVDEARSILEEGLKKFPDDEDLQEALQILDDDMNDTDGNKAPAFISISLLLSSILKSIKKKK